MLKPQSKLFPRDGRLHWRRGQEESAAHRLGLRGGAENIAMQWTDGVEGPNLLPLGCEAEWLQCIGASARVEMSPRSTCGALMVGVLETSGWSRWLGICTACETASGSWEETSTCLQSTSGHAQPRATFKGACAEVV